MKKKEFLERLKGALNGRVSPRVLAENIAYYEDYINTQVRMGAREEEVIASLGNPRLLAKSVIDAEKRKGNTGQAGEYAEYTEYTDQTDRGYESFTRQYDPFGGAGYAGYNGYTNGEYDGTEEKKKHLPAWAVILLVILGFVLITSLIISAIFSLIVFFLPILIPVILVVFIIRLMRKA